MTGTVLAHSGHCPPDSPRLEIAMDISTLWLARNLLSIGAIHRYRLATAPMSSTRFRIRDTTAQDTVLIGGTEQRRRKR